MISEYPSYEIFLNYLIKKDNLVINLFMNTSREYIQSRYSSIYVANNALVHLYMDSKTVIMKLKCSMFWFSTPNVIV